MELARKIPTSIQAIVFLLLIIPILFFVSKILLWLLPSTLLAIKVLSFLLKLLAHPLLLIPFILFLFVVRTNLSHRWLYVAGFFLVITSVYHGLSETLSSPNEVWKAFLPFVKSKKDYLAIFNTSFTLFIWGGVTILFGFLFGKTTRFTRIFVNQAIAIVFN